MLAEALINILISLGVENERDAFLKRSCQVLKVAYHSSLSLSYLVFKLPFIHRERKIGIDSFKKTFNLTVPGNREKLKEVKKFDFVTYLSVNFLFQVLKKKS